MNEAETRETLIAMELAALELWSKGDPSGYLNHAAVDVTYFDHPSTTSRRRESTGPKR